MVATVTQFNAVSFRVISSILIEPKLRPQVWTIYARCFLATTQLTDYILTQERAIIIATWIDIAQELRILKNFSSLKAIVSGLQSNAIYRLSKTWAALAREKVFNTFFLISKNSLWNGETIVAIFIKKKIPVVIHITKAHNLFSLQLQLEIFNELARIFSEENNAWAQREVLMREGTAKFADTTGENDRHLQKVFQKQVRSLAVPTTNHTLWPISILCHS